MTGGSWQRRKNWNVNTNIGHQHSKVLKAIKEQADKLCYIAPSFGSKSRGELAELMVSHTPGDLNKVFFTTGGGESNDKDRDTKEPLAPWNGPDPGIMARLNKCLREQGVYVYIRWNNIIIAPPIAINEEELKFGLDAVDNCLDLADKALRIY
ncbi:MAG: aminotransferase class III-fold pyridoxal phosphate-dependent enzyme [Bacillota bacterium]